LKGSKTVLKSVSRFFITLAISAQAIGCGSSSPGTSDGGAPAADGGSARDGGSATADGGSSGADGGAVAGTVTVASSGNRLPAAWNVTDATLLKSDGTGAGAQAHALQLTTLSVSTTVSNNPCPLPYTSMGHTYCDGFNATDGSGHAVVVDTFSYLGAHPSCTLPTSGTLSSITGIWQGSYDSMTMTTTWTLALADCSGVGLGTPYAGSNAAPSSTDIHDTLASAATGTSVTVRGIVVGTWSAAPAFGFTIQDTGGSNTGIKVTRGKTSTSTATAPRVGDYVTVTGKLDVRATEIEL
jgi:hypothetical protein